MLPNFFAGKEQDKLRYGDTSIPLMLEKIKKNGATKLRAKIFGGARMFDFKVSNITIAEDNIAIARRILRKQGIRIIAEDVGGNVGRIVRFHPLEGWATVRVSKRIV